MLGSCMEHWILSYGEGYVVVKKQFDGTLVKHPHRHQKGFNPNQITCNYSHGYVITFS